ncbi:cinnamyl alcohol dehydrogenase-like protein [Hibiscus syriacus]|uniref:Cinnamyl alcohol dehydrogenase-like protein n=1 Tax=Hibiscus syriacus TaxID=106335 RepID=A0A6A3A8Z3_HIBSY|nr:cinnamyl alcohol dehydrogenase-like protein [Hibiscus syriacus]
MASVLHPLLSAYLLLLLPLVTAQSGAGEIGVGSSIKASRDAKSWVYPSSDFAFGFQQLENNEDLFILAIWYYKVQIRTIVWYANGYKPAPTRSKIELIADRGLVLSDPRGQLIWRSEIATGKVTVARMNDTCNFEIKKI